ncbi:MAG: sugar kinase [Clostridia bacterium]|nr:sugar kinase [Clostridia bacterium]
MRLSSQGSRPFDAIGMGEVMLRLTPPDRDRISLSATFEKSVGGSELNVMCGISQLGLRTAVLTALPDNALGHFVKNRIRYNGVSDDFLVFDQTEDARLGTYFYEMGVHPRKPSVLYDRKNSSFVNMTFDQIDPDLPASTRAFHVSGITLGLNRNIRETAMRLVRECKDAGCLITFDVNYRAALWSEEEAKAAVDEILPLVDVLFVSEETSRRMLARTGTAQEIIRSFVDDYGMQIVCMTMRTVSSPTRHNWDSMLYDAGRDIFYREAPYTDIEVVDRIGSGDAYLSGVLAGLLGDYGPLQALKMGNAMAAMKNTVFGDMPASDPKEVRSIIAAHDGAVQDELNR